MSESYLTHPRDALLREIIANGVTHGTVDKPIVSRDGQYGTTMRVDRSPPWEGAATSLLAGCVMHSGGDYNASLVRPEPKPDRSGKQIESAGD